MSLERKGSLKKDPTKSTAEGEWEMRDGKWYRKEHYAAEVEAPPPPPPAPVPFVCQVCPTIIIEIEKYQKLVIEIEQQIAARRSYLSQLQIKLEELRAMERAWLADRERLLQIIADLERLLAERRNWVTIEMINEKRAYLLSLEERIALLTKERDALLVKVAKLVVIIDDFEKQYAICKEKGYLCNITTNVIHTPPPPPPMVPVMVLKQQPAHRVVEEVVEHVQPVVVRSVQRKMIPTGSVQSYEIGGWVPANQAQAIQQPLAVPQAGAVWSGYTQTLPATATITQAQAFPAQVTQVQAGQWGPWQISPGAVQTSQQVVMQKQVVQQIQQQQGTRF